MAVDGDRAGKAESRTLPSGPSAYVDLGSPSNVARWLRELDVTRDQLEAAVRAVGVRGPDVEFYLTGRRSDEQSPAV